MIKLNLGSGDQHIPGYINIDLAPGADIIHDLRNPLPFETASVAHIFACHVIESFYQWEFPAILKDWARVLNGSITIEFTCLTNSIMMYLNGNEEDRRSGHWGLYGRQDIPIDPIVLHHYVYEKDELHKLLIDAGFTDIEFTEENVAHKKGRDYRVTANHKK